ncbi:methyltransferase domain-containing protein [Sphingobacterium lactis]|uniref:methyltransferase domain-containing protein n=1 Tax=Sphingobacterium lactis TaxID=797291 RepID=UPI003DA47F55
MDKEYWNARWENQQTGWDIGYASTPIVTFFNTFPDKDAKILIPGCGNAYEAAHLLEAGFTNITLIDIAPRAIAQVKERFAGQQIEILLGDFFDLKGDFDLMLEQTFFCALEPSQRPDYVKQASRLLERKGGEIVGVLFGVTFEKEGPPFGGSAEAYEQLFEKEFTIRKLEPCYNSIGPRQGTELFIRMAYKNG